jgi:hypothetical protein
LTDYVVRGVPEFALDDDKAASAIGCKNIDASPRFDVVRGDPVLAGLKARVCAPDQVGLEDGEVVREVADHVLFVYEWLVFWHGGVGAGSNECQRHGKREEWDPGA